MLIDFYIIDVFFGTLKPLFIYNYVNFLFMCAIRVLVKKLKLRLLDKIQNAFDTVGNNYLMYVDSVT